MESWTSREERDLRQAREVAMSDLGKTLWSVKRSFEDGVAEKESQY